jgi:hypothetical protein
MTTSTSTTQDESARWQTVLRRWPSALGLATAAVALAVNGNREAIAITVSLAALCYVAAAAFGRPWVAWPAILGGTIVVVVSGMIGLVWWAGVGITAIALVVVGLIGRVPRAALASQTGALVVYGGVAVAALSLGPRVGLAVAGVALASHGVWDLIHYRRNRVVSRSLAEFCVVLDVPLGVGVVILALTN